MTSSWFLLNYIPPRGKSRAMLPALIERFNATLREDLHNAPQHPNADAPQLPHADANYELCSSCPQLPHADANYELCIMNYELTLFAPTFVTLSTDTGNPRQTEKPLLYHYIFLRGDEATIKLLTQNHQGFSFVLDHSTETPRRVTIDDHTMDQFRTVALFYGNRLPCYSLEGINLEEGDKVQIVSGPCAGLTGTYISRKGGKSGNILIAVDTNMAVVVYDVKADLVRVLEFSRDSRRVYDQLDAFTARLLPHLSVECKSSSTCIKSSKLDAEEDFNPIMNSELCIMNSKTLASSAAVFTRRLGAVKLHNPKLDAKLQILLYAAYSILADRSNAGMALEKYNTLSHHITNPKTRSLAASILTTFPPSTP